MLFLCGECAQTDFWLHFPFQPDSQRPYTLPDYAVQYTGSGRAFVTPQPGAAADGILCCVSVDLLWTMDQWKQLPLLQRTALTGAATEDGAAIETYLNNAAVPVPAAACSPLDWACFSTLYNENELGKCDLHLMFPCSFENFFPSASAAADPITETFMQQIAKANAEEFAGEYLSLRRGALGVYPFGIGFSDEDRARHTQWGFVHFSIHDSTLIGTVSIVLPATLVSALYGLNAFCSNALTITAAGHTCNFLDWLQQCGISVHGTPRAALFTYNPISQDQLIRCLAMERNPMGTLTGPSLRSYCQDNFAQYDTADVYAAEKCLVEISHTCQTDLYTRLSVESLEIYFVELLSMQTASIHRICAKILQYMNGSELLGSEKDYDKLITLSSEMSSAVLFFDYNQFLYPTVSIACKKISQRFGMEGELEKYYKYREILEQMIQLSHEQRDKIENNNLNLLLLLLTVVQVLPTFVDTFQMCLSGSWSPSILLSWLYSILACAALCGLFSWYKRRQIRRISKRQKRSI